MCELDTTGWREASGVVSATYDSNAFPCPPEQQHFEAQALIRGPQTHYHLLWANATISGITERSAPTHRMMTRVSGRPSL